MSIHNRIRDGAAAVRAGSPDVGMNDPDTDLADALANILHYASAKGLDFDSALTRAIDYHNLEADEPGESS